MCCYRWRTGNESERVLRRWCLPGVRGGGGGSAARSRCTPASVRASVYMGPAAAAACHSIRRVPVCRAPSPPVHRRRATLSTGPTVPPPPPPVALSLKRLLNPDRRPGRSRGGGGSRRTAAVRLRSPSYHTHSSSIYVICTSSTPASCPHSRTHIYTRV